MAKELRKDYLPDIPAAFQDIKVYIGIMKKPLEKSLRYYMYLRYGKNWKKTIQYKRINFLVTSLELAKNTNNNLARDLKKWRHVFDKALDELLILVSESDPHKSDEHYLNLIISFHKDVDRVFRTVMKSKDTFRN